ncbi:MAG: MjaI family restriction endonuclease [Candidatus Pacearchaeota archaeon]|nr:MjaI family restriction endonuclease [Candidatus Pacearchaeota archaeon]
MAKEWVLNSVMNRFQLNFKRNVGATSESIRKCSPRSLEEWKKYYYQNVKSKEHIDSLGKKLFEKINNEIKKELGEITEKDCIEYMHNLVINRTYDGYNTEISMIKSILKEGLNIDIKEAPDEWDRLFNVDFFIKVNDKFIGLQIKPAGSEEMLQVIKERKQQLGTHKKFTEKYGGKVFYVYSIKKNDKKILANPEIIEEIKTEIKRLS